MKNLIACLVITVLSSITSAMTPVANEDFKLLASDGAIEDYFGYSVSISSDGTIAIVGARYDDDNESDSGSAYIYSLVQGIWQETKLLASDGANGEDFGYSVSISSDGTIAIVGARYDDDNGSDSGSAYIYSLVQGIWQETKLLASDGENGDHFGYSVSISSDGTIAIVGARYDDDNGSDSGSAYIYSLAQGIWQETKLLASDGASSDRFGESVFISSDGTTAIVGARYDDDNGSESGSAYIYSHVKGIWQETKLLASDGVSSDHFGESVSISSDGTTAIVGAYFDDDNGSDSGSAYIYSHVKGIWQETKLLASDGVSSDHFGESVSISSDGTTAIVGAHLDNDNGSESGSAYIYSLVQGIWQEIKLLASDGASGDHFGESVSISSDGTTAIVGSHRDNDNGFQSGSAYIFDFTQGVVWTVDDDGKADFDNIQEAVDAASDGDEIVVMPGTYTGSGGFVVIMNGKAVWLHSSDGPSVTFINGEDTRRVLWCNDGETETTVIEGFTITRGYGGAGAFGGGILMSNGSSPNVLDCIISGNTTLHFGGGICNYTGAPTISNCTITNNYSKLGGGGIKSYGAGGVLTLVDTVICGNAPDQVSGNVIDNGGNTVADECPPDCPDINGDGYVNVTDLLAVIDQWGLTDSPADVNGDGVVNVSDVLLIISNWGPCE